LTPQNPATDEARICQTNSVPVTAGAPGVVPAPASVILNAVKDPVPSVVPGPSAPAATPRPPAALCETNSAPAPSVPCVASVPAVPPAHTSGPSTPSTSDEDDMSWVTVPPYPAPMSRAARRNCETNTVPQVPSDL